MEPAAAGASGLQQNYRPALLALAVLVALVLLIACANVANLMTAQAAARAREMALRVSIGAGRGRLVQLVLVESAMIAFLAAAMGGVFAWWSAPFVVGMINPPDNPARLSLPADWRVLGFGLALTLAVTFLFGLAPALRASAVNPASALKGGSDPHARRRSMHALIAAQSAFCFLVLFVAGLFVTTFDRLSHRAPRIFRRAACQSGNRHGAGSAAGFLGPGGRTSADHPWCPERCSGRMAPPRWGSLEWLHFGQRRASRPCTGVLSAAFRRVGWTP